MILSEGIVRYSQQYDLGFGADIQWKNNVVSSIVFTIQDSNLNSDVNMDEIAFLLFEWYAEYFMDAPSAFI